MTDAVYIITMATDRVAKGGGKVCAFYADMQDAFANLMIEELWEIMKRLQVEENLRWRINNIYEKRFVISQLMEKK